MSLQIIGSGFGRTGTLSTKTALERLGFGPCHHMIEVMRDPRQPAYWAELADGRTPDWTQVFSGFQSQVDFPGAAVWRDLLAAFPNAKVIHTERPEEEWWASYSTTIGKFFAHRESLPLPEPAAALFATMDRLLIGSVFGGLDRERSIEAYRRNNAAVREIVPRERLLVFSPAEGWEPLCRFLGAPVPEEAFPRTNAREEFWAVFGGAPEPA